jgi:hypothetical protein
MIHLSTSLYFPNIARSYFTANKDMKKILKLDIGVMNQEYAEGFDQLHC